jgi:hypothetical protein
MRFKNQIKIQDLKLAWGEPVRCLNSKQDEHIVSRVWESAYTSSHNCVLRYIVMTEMAFLALP